MVPRAQRFQIEVPMRYRAFGHHDWLKATTVNISASGVLFAAEPALAPETPVEMTLTLPQQIANAGAGRVLCHGRIVRVADVDGHAALAATIANYRLMRESELLQ
jgi:hypothetical protein